MSPVDIEALIGVATFLLTTITSALIVGIAWGRVTTKISNMENTLSEIKGMFRLTLKD